MINENWTILDQDSTRKFISEVRDEKYAPLFDSPAYELWAYELPFFEGYSRYRLNNLSIAPSFCMDYISNGENHYYLDGTEHPIALLLKRDCLRLTAENILNYLDFFDEVAFSSDFKLKFIVDESDIGEKGASAMPHHFKAIQMTATRGIEEFKDYFNIRLPALLNEQTVQAHVQVKKTGQITILSPTSKDFLAGTYDFRFPLKYHHPHEDLLWKETLSLLQTSAEGLRLSEVAEELRANVTILSGLLIDSFAAKETTGFISAPSSTDKTEPHLIVALAALLRDFEIQASGSTRGSLCAENTDEQVSRFAEANCAFNLDIWLKLCTICEEMEKTGEIKVIDSFKKLGFEPIYAAYKNSLSGEDLLKTVMQMMNIRTREE